jgi:hypothetical protein
MRFDTTLFLTGNNTGIEVPSDIVEQLGGGRRPAVNVVVNGFAYRSTIASMGGRYLIPFSADKRAATGISGGDPISVELSLDTAPREVEVPGDLASALDAADLRAAFDALAPSARKAHVANVEGAKAEETRRRRIAAIVRKLTP